MSKVSVQLSNSLEKQLRECAIATGTSVDQLISSAVAEKLAALTPEYLEVRGQRASRKKFEAALATIPDVEPPEFDRLPKQSPRVTPRQRRKPLKKAAESR